MGKKKAARERVCADCNRERVRFGLHVGVDGGHGGARAWRRDRAGEYPDGGSLRKRIGGVPWKSSCGEGVSQRRLPMTLASTGVYLLLLLLGNLLFVGAAPTDGLAVCLPSIGAAILAALLVSRKPKTRRRR